MEPLLADAAGRNTQSPLTPGGDGNRIRSSGRKAVTISVYTGLGGEVVIPATIDFSAFDRCTGLTTISISGSVASIGGLAFYG